MKSWRIVFAIFSALAIARALYPWPGFADPDGDPARGVALHPKSTRLRSAYSLQLERRGEFAAAEAQLLEASRNDRQFAPAWQLADFYFRHERPDEFLRWAHAAAERSYGDLSALFRLCSLVNVSESDVLTQILVRPSIERNYVAWLLEEKRTGRIPAVAGRLAGRNDPEDRELLLAYIEDLIHGLNVEPAWRLWRRLYPEDGPLTNPAFGREPLGRGFDWRPIAQEGVHQRRLTTAPGTGWNIEFLGGQTELSDLLTQYLALTPGRRYAIRAQADYPPELDGGLFWVIDGIEVEFSGTRGFRCEGPLSQLVLRYRRKPGTTRFAGALRIDRVVLTERGE
jgi:hypothetical protein